jgi:hypothetical protein
MQRGASVLPRVPPVHIYAWLPQKPVQLEDDPGLSRSPQPRVDGCAALLLHVITAHNTSVSNIRRVTTAPFNAEFLQRQSVHGTNNARWAAAAAEAAAEVLDV